MSHQRVSDQAQTFSLYRESASSTPGYAGSNAVLDANINKLISIGTAGILEPFVRDDWSNEDHRGKGHEFATAAELMKWGVEGGINDVADSTLLGMLLYLALGAVTTTTPTGGTNSRDHTFVPMSTANGLQLPSSSWGAQHHVDVGWYKYLGLVVDELSISGGKNEYVNYDARLIGNGKRVAMAGYSVPAFSDHILLRDSVSTFKWGTPGSPDTYTSEIVSWKLTINNNHIINDGYYPNGTDGLFDPTDSGKGMIASRMLIGDRKYSMSLTVLMSDEAALTAQAANTAKEILITSQGDEIESGYYNGLTVQVKDSRFRSVRLGEQDGLVAYNIEPFIKMPSSGLLADLLTVILRNEITEYGILQT